MCFNGYMSAGFAVVGFLLSWWIWSRTNNTKLAIGVFFFFGMEFLQVLQYAFDIASSPATCTLAIADTGPGIPLESREKIFQLYYTTKPHGSGIGLAMTFRAVQLHGGTIEIASEAGHGTMFRLTLPLTGMDRAV